MNKETYDSLVQILNFLIEGRAFMAREKLEHVLGLTNSEESE
jgi:hypothetical protein